MKYALITDNSVQWFTFLVSILDTGEVAEYYSLDAGIQNDYLSNIFRRGPDFSNLRLTIPSTSVDNFYGNWISEYDFKRVRKMISLYPSVLEYKLLGELKKI